MAHAPVADMVSIPIDEQLAAEMEVRTVQRLKEDWAQQLQMLCDQHDAQIAEAWQRIQRHMADFDCQKAVVLATLRKVEGDERAARVIDKGGLGGMTPLEYAKIAQHMEDEDSAAVPPARSSYSSPPQSPRAPRAQMPPTTTTAATAATATTTTTTTMTTSPPARAAGPILSPPPLAQVASLVSPPRSAGPLGGKVIGHMKRTGNPALHSAPPAKKQKSGETSRPATVTSKFYLGTWEVEYTDYIFTYPAFGDGWFVLRCNHGLPTQPLSFTSHPFDKDHRAADHFNGSKSHMCHDTSRHYTNDEIMKEFAHRVQGDKLNDEWVRAANKRLEVECAKRLNTSKAKGKQIA